MLALTTRAGEAPLLAETAPVPLGPADLRVRVAAAAVNPADLFLATDAGRAHFGLPDAIGLGWDVAGTVTEVGPDVTGFAAGDRVAALDRNPAAVARTHAEEVVVPAAAAARVPEGVSLEAAATLPLNGLTARQALDLLGPAAGRTLLVTGAAGAVGGFAVALAARDGWTVAGLARATDEDFVRGAGATDLLTEVPGPRFDAVLDAAVLEGGALAGVRDGGTLVCVHEPIETARGVEVSGVLVEPDGGALAELLDLVAEGVLEPRVAGTVPLRDVLEGYARAGAGGQRGRWLVVP